MAFLPTLISIATSSCRRFVAPPDPANIDPCDGFRPCCRLDRGSRGILGIASVTRKVWNKRRGFRFLWRRPSAEQKRRAYREEDMKRRTSLLAFALAATFGLCASNVHAADIISEWASVKAPPPPALQQVTVDAKDTALLMLDFLHSDCNPEHGKRCMASFPIVKKLLDEARAKHMLVVYSAYGKNTEKNIWADVAPNGTEPFVVAFLDKFIGTDLDKILKSKGIKTVIVVGSAANGAAFGTASAAAQRGFTVIVPVDGISSDDLYAEQSAVWNMKHAPVIGSKITLTRVDMMKF
jgi:nicotinamidase-related amidase